MRIMLWIAGALALVGAAYLFNLALFHTWAISAPSTADPGAEGKWAGRFFGFAFLLGASGVGLIVMAVRAGKGR
ncbi:MAG TPA: hypothetical protein VF147_12155 [Vicinamibacterales bacterium]